ncbi:FtsL-like putative cell division protein [Emticicia sp. 17c]|uniref:FtsL-like putative cell division protein n=1 Tax=Emticicia sp. 17c TaxID=3127704 RepID=UPI00301D71A1
MATNTFRHRSAPVMEAPPRKSGLFDRLNTWLTNRLNLGDTLPTETLKRIVWLGILCIFYIYMQHSYEGFIKKIEKSRSEMEERRAEYISQKSRYMFASKQSEIAKKLTDKGLEENITPPNKIVVTE